MGAKGMLVAMVAGTALVMVLGRRSETHRVPAPKRPPPEQPWLSNEATAQIVGPEGQPGPLFDWVMLGGPPPSPEVRDAIAEFARKNHVDIDIEIRDGGVTAIRFAVTFGGCCGYEAADKLGLRLQRPSTGVCCVCGPDTWINDWTNVSDTGVHTRVSINVNKVTVRWEPTVTYAGALERAEELLGADPEVVAKAAGDRWREVELHHYLLEVAYPFYRYLDFAYPRPFTHRPDLGFQVTVERGKVAQVQVPLPNMPDEDNTALKGALRERWGKPHVEDETWIWKKGDRVITAELDGYPTMVTIQSKLFQARE